MGNIVMISDNYHDIGRLLLLTIIISSKNRTTLITVYGKTFTVVHKTHYSLENFHGASGPCHYVLYTASDSRGKLLRLAKKPRKPWKFSPSKVLPYTVLSQKISRLIGKTGELPIPIPNPFHLVYSNILVTNFKPHIVGGESRGFD